MGNRPLLAFPCASYNAHIAALHCFPAYTRKRKLFLIAMQMAVRTGVSSRLWKTVFSPLSVIDASVLTTWLETLSEQLHKPCLYPVFVWPADAERGRVYIHLLDQSGNRVAFVKLALDQSNIDLIQNEKSVLRQLNTARWPNVRVPKVLGEGMIQGCCYLMVESAPQQAKTIDRKNTLVIDEIISVYAGEPWRMPMVEVEKLMWWQCFMGQTQFDSKLFQTIKDVALDGVDVCRVHGDLNQTNILLTGEEVWLLDWERSCKAAPYLTDAICAEVDLLWPITQKNIALAFNRFRAVHWDNQGLKYRHGVLLALAFLHAADFTPATAMLEYWHTAE